LLATRLALMVCRIGHHDHWTSTALTSMCEEYMQDLGYECKVDAHEDLICHITHVVKQAVVYNEAESRQIEHFLQQ
jgi:hypothetical protein